MPQSAYSLSFDGSNDFLVTADITGLNGATKASLSAWIYRASSQNVWVGGAGSPSVSSTLFGITWASSDFLVISGAGGAYGYVGLSGTGWHHVAVDYDGTQTGNANRLKCWLDGSPVTFDGFIGTVPATLTNVSPLTAGLADSIFYAGQIDDIALWVGTNPLAANAAGITAGSTNVASLSPTGLWRLEEGSGTTTVDTSGNGFDAVLVNGVTWSSTVPAALASGSGPAAVNDTASAVSGIAKTINVLANDSLNGATTLAVVSSGGHSATVTVNTNSTATVADDSITYTAPATFFGTDTFSYSISDGAATSSATVTVTVAAPGSGSGAHRTNAMSGGIG